VVHSVSRHFSWLGANSGANWKEKNLLPSVFIRDASSWCLMILFHVTSRENAEAIRRDGFRDAPGFYTTENEFRGVWFFDRPSDANDDPRDDTVLAVDLPLSAADLDAYEWKQEGKSHREWLIPAAFVNKYWWPTSS